MAGRESIPTLLSKASVGDEATIERAAQLDLVEVSGADGDDPAASINVCFE